jgi:hypothetical protein
VHTRPAHRQAEGDELPEGVDELLDVLRAAIDQIR